MKFIMAVILFQNIMWYHSLHLLCVYYIIGWPVAAVAPTNSIIGGPVAAAVAATKSNTELDTSKTRAPAAQLSVTSRYSDVRVSAPRSLYSNNDQVDKRLLGPELEHDSVISSAKDQYTVPMLDNSWAIHPIGNGGRSMVRTDFKASPSVDSLDWTPAKSPFRLSPQPGMYFDLDRKLVLGLQSESKDSFMEHNNEEQEEDIVTASNADRRSRVFSLDSVGNSRRMHQLTNTVVTLSPPSNILYNMFYTEASKPKTTFMNSNGQTSKKPSESYNNALQRLKDTGILVRNSYYYDDTNEGYLDPSFDITIPIERKGSIDPQDYVAVSFPKLVDRKQFQKPKSEDIVNDEDPKSFLTTGTSSLETEQDFLNMWHNSFSSPSLYARNIEETNSQFDTTQKSSNDTYLQSSSNDVEQNNIDLISGDVLHENSHQNDDNVIIVTPLSTISFNSDGRNEMENPSLDLWAVSDQIQNYEPTIRYEYSSLNPDFTARNINEATEPNEVLQYMKSIISSEQTFNSRKEMKPSLRDPINYESDLNQQSSDTYSSEVYNTNHQSTNEADPFVFSSLMEKNIGAKNSSGMTDQMVSFSSQSTARSPHFSKVVHLADAIRANKKMSNQLINDVATSTNPQELETNTHFQSPFDREVIRSNFKVVNEMPKPQLNFPKREEIKHTGSSENDKKFIDHLLNLRKSLSATPPYSTMNDVVPNLESLDSSDANSNAWKRVKNYNPDNKILQSSLDTATEPSFKNLNQNKHNQRNKNVFKKDSRNRIGPNRPNRVPMSDWNIRERNNTEPSINPGKRNTKQKNHKPSWPRRIYNYIASSFFSNPGNRNGDPFYDDLEEEGDFDNHVAESGNVKTPVEQPPSHFPKNSWPRIGVVTTDMNSPYDDNDMFTVTAVAALSTLTAAILFALNNPFVGRETVSSNVETSNPSLSASIENTLTFLGEALAEYQNYVAFSGQFYPELGAYDHMQHDSDYNQEHLHTMLSAIKEKQINNFKNNIALFVSNAYQYLKTYPEDIGINLILRKCLQLYNTMKTTMESLNVDFSTFLRSKTLLELISTQKINSELTTPNNVSNEVPVPESATLYSAKPYISADIDLNPTISVGTYIDLINETEIAFPVTEAPQYNFESFLNYLNSSNIYTDVNSSVEDLFNLSKPSNPNVDKKSITNHAKFHNITDGLGKFRTPPAIVVSNSRSNYNEARVKPFLKEKQFNLSKVVDGQRKVIINNVLKNYSKLIPKNELYTSAEVVSPGNNLVRSIAYNQPVVAVRGVFVNNKLHAPARSVSHRGTFVT